MTPEQKYTERDLVMAKREVFDEGARWQRLELARGDASGEMTERAYRVAAERYPMPKVKRPRVMADPHGSAVCWRFNGSNLQWRAVESKGWAVYPESLPGAGHLTCFATPERIALWANLAACPDELVEETSHGNGGQS